MTKLSKLSNAFVDITPLQISAPYRRLWAATTLSSIASQMAVLTVTYQVYEITRSTLYVGLIGLCVVVPTIIFTLIGGHWADTYDRRKLSITLAGCQLLVVFGFIGQSVSDANSVWLLLALVTVQAAISSLAVPARRTFIRSLVPAKHLPAAISLNMLSIHVGFTLGPFLGGLAAGFSTTASYSAQGMGVLASLLALASLPQIAQSASPSTHALVAIQEGLRYVFKNKSIKAALSIDLSMTLLGAPIALFPAINAEFFGGQAATLGGLSAALALGGVAGSVFSGPASRIKRQGHVCAVAALIWGLTVIVLFLVPNYWIMLLLLAFNGVVDVTSMNAGASIVQGASDEAFRGRVSSIEHLTQMAGPQLGALRAGIGGSIVNPVVVAATGGVATFFVVSFIYFRSDALRNYSVNQEEASEHP